MVKLLVSLCVVAVVAGLTTSTIITPPAVTNWGTWAPRFERCPAGRACQGFQLLVEPSFGVTTVDDTTLNGIRLFCGNPSDGVTPQITSHVGNWGKWGALYRCKDGAYLSGIQLKVERPLLFALDDTSVNNVRFFCTNSQGKPIEGDGERFGSWGKAVHCPKGQVVCGIKTQVQEDQGALRDDTSLNNVSLECCPIPQ